MPASQCSTGEQKALLVSIILAHVRLQTARQGQPPLLLLDEVAAHLDQNRRHHLFERVTTSGVQAWMTGTDLAIFTEFGDHFQMFTVADGTVTPAPTATVVAHPNIRGA